MAKKTNIQAADDPSGSQRRHLVEQLRQDQIRNERRRGIVILGICVVVFLAIVGAALVPYLNKKQATNQAADVNQVGAIGASLAQAQCDPVQESAATGSGVHQPDGTKLSYPDSPPASGAHWGTFLYGTQLRAFFTREDRPPVEQMVHSLEHGHTLAWYDETVQPGTQAYDDLRRIAEKLPESVGLIALPWNASDGDPMPAGKHIALTHWTGPDNQRAVHQYCAAPSSEAITQFVSAYGRSNAPEPGAP